MSKQSITVTYHESGVATCYIPELAMPEELTTESVVSLRFVEHVESMNRLRVRDAEVESLRNRESYVGWNRRTSRELRCKEREWSRIATKLLDTAIDWKAMRK